MLRMFRAQHLSTSEGQVSLLKGVRIKQAEVKEMARKQACATQREEHLHRPGGWRPA